MAHKLIDLKAGGKALIVAHLACFQIDGELVIIDFSGSAHELKGVGFAQAHREEAILGGVIGENIGE